jgi:hypothetical protein
MQTRRCARSLVNLALMSAIVPLAVKIVSAQQEAVLHSFSRGSTERGGSNLYISVIFDKVGNLYGTNLYGGTHDNETVFELMPNFEGAWSEDALHSFGAYPGDGYDPSGSLVFDPLGNLYGTTYYGHGATEYGTVFQVIPQDGKWTWKIIHVFNDLLVAGTQPLARFPTPQEISAEWRTLD